MIRAQNIGNDTMVEQRWLNEELVTTAKVFVDPVTREEYSEPYVVFESKLPMKPFDQTIANVEYAIAGAINYQDAEAA